MYSTINDTLCHSVSETRGVRYMGAPAQTRSPLAILPPRPLPPHLLPITDYGRLPLAERDANLIIQYANQAPFGHNQETVVDTSFRDTFEISASRVQFINDRFHTWLLLNLLPAITARLGIRRRAKETNLEFYKLLLYRTGSQ